MANCPIGVANQPYRNVSAQAYAPGNESVRRHRVCIRRTLIDVEEGDRRLVAAWLRYEAEKERHENDPDWWAVEELQAVFLEDPDRAWEIAAELTRESETEWQIVMIGCGILEDLLELNADRYLERLDVEGRTNRKLITAAAHVWGNNSLQSRLDTLLFKYGQPRL
jgi:hypothetical protein